MIAQFVVRLEQFLGQSEVAARFAAKLRNACNRVIGYHLAPTTAADANGEFKALETLAPTVERFIDVGANRGDWSAHLLGRGSPGVKGLLLEPSKDAQIALEKRFGADSRVRVLPLAVGEREGSLTFYDEPGGGETSSAVRGFSREDAVERVVSVTTLDALAGAEGWTSIDLVKIDVEGLDMAVIRGAHRSLAAHQIAFLQFEYNLPWALAGSTLGQALAYLGQYDYRVFAITPRGLEEPRYRVFGEYFEYSNYLAASPSASQSLEHLTL